MQVHLKVFVIAVAAVFQVLAQPQPSRRLVSPEVQPDRQITFRLAAPKALEVQLRFAEGAVRTHTMTKGADGVWSVTLGPVDPETYTYSYLVDGLKVLDVANPDIKLGLALDASVVEVPGTPARFDQLRNVPHGSVNMHSYQATAQDRQRAMYIYVPPQYYTEASRKFPVLYLWHGAGGVESDWSRDGRTAIILDNLIAEKKAVPMIIVMPNNNVLAPVAGGAFGSSGVLEKELLNDIIPFVEKNYRVLANRNNRAIAGLSAGGGTTMNVGMRHLELFAWLGEFSSGIFGGAGVAAAAAVPAGGGAGYGAWEPEKIAPGIYQNLVSPARKPRVFWMSVGTEDPRLPFHKQALEDFQKHGIEPTFKTYPGAHEWKVWRHSLAEFAPVLFR